MKRHIEIKPEYEHLRSYIERLPEIMESDGIYIYGGRRNLIKRFTAPDGTELNVKRFRKPRLLNNIIYSTGIRTSKGRRAYTYPDRLLAKGVETPRAVAYIEERNAVGLLGQSYFVSIQCPYRHQLYEMGDAQPEAYEPMAKALALFAAHMHDQQVLHRDFSPGNILWDHQSPVASYPSPITFSVVDINRMQFGPVSMQEGCKNFARLWGPKRFIQLLVEEYCHKRGFNPQEGVAIAMDARAAFWKRYQRKHEIEFTLEI